MASFYPLQAQPFTLAGAGVSVGDSTLVLSSFKQINGTTNITMADLGTIAYGTVEPGNGTQEEQISFTGVTQNANGTATLTGVSSVANSTPYAETANFTIAHAGGVQFVLSNTAGFYSKFPPLPDSASVTGLWTFSTANFPQMNESTTMPSSAAQLATKGYADSLTYGGAPNANMATKGIIQLATGTQIAVGTILGSTGAALVPPNSIFNATSSATTIAVVTGTTGKISSGFGGTALGLATLDSSTLVVENPASATATPAAAKIPISALGNTAGTSTTTAYLNGWVSTAPGSLSGGSTTVHIFVAGETIDASSAPKALYLKESDGRVYKLDSTAATEAAFAFIGFAPIQASVSAGNNILVQLSGMVTGFTGLTVGGYYFGTNTAGSISTTPGTITYQVGRAITATTLVIFPGQKVYSGTLALSATGTTTITVGFRAQNVRIEVAEGGTGTKNGMGGWDVNGGNNSVAFDGTSANTYTNAWDVGAAGTKHAGIVTSITSSTFALVNTKTGSPNNAALYWQAQG